MNRRTVHHSALLLSLLTLLVSLCIPQGVAKASDVRDVSCEFTQGYGLVLCEAGNGVDLEDYYTAELTVENNLNMWLDISIKYQVGAEVLEYLPPEQPAGTTGIIRRAWGRLGLLPPGGKATFDARFFQPDANVVFEVKPGFLSFFINLGNTLLAVVPGSETIQNYLENANRVDLVIESIELLFDIPDLYLVSGGRL